jgi:hypothetical protein
MNEEMPKDAQEKCIALKNVILDAAIKFSEENNITAFLQLLTMSSLGEVAQLELNKYLKESREKKEIIQ